jgi:hypothetical protein
VVDGLEGDAEGQAHEDQVERALQHARERQLVVTRRQAGVHVDQWAS